MKKILLNVLAILLILNLAACIKQNENPATGTPSPLTSLTQLRSIYKGQDLTIASDMLAGAVNVRGVVISDHSGKNLPERYVIIQNSSRGTTSGMILDMDAAAAQSFVPGDSIEVRVEGLSLINRKRFLIA